MSHPTDLAPDAGKQETGSAHSIGWAQAIVRTFIDSRLTPLLLLFSVLVGAFAVLELPREEEPQIKVPMIDVYVRMEGASPAEVEERISKPMEKFFWEIPGVEYVYSTSSPGLSLAVIRFLVGHDEESAIVKVNQKMSMHFDLIPKGATPPLIKPRSIDDVPILALTFWSSQRDHYDLRRIAGDVADAINAVPDVSETTLTGGCRRQVRVSLDPAALTAHGVTTLDVAARIEAANLRVQASDLVHSNSVSLVEAGRLLKAAEDIANVVVGERGNRPVHLHDVARITDGPEEPNNYVFFEAGAAMESAPRAPGASTGPLPAVTLSIAKRRGTNASRVARAVLEVVRHLEGMILPRDVQVTVTRNYGETAANKSDELLLHMGIAVVSVTLLIWFALGWRESGIVALAIPVTLALTLAVFYLLGYTLNRITLFALIFSIGILVDDPIVDVENIVRHFRMPENRGANLLRVTMEAVNEVRSPLILATLTVICAVLPMAFVRGLMGPYMRPIPVGASTAMLLSMCVAFVITPWAAHRILSGPARRGALHAAGPEAEEDLLTRLYRAFMGRLIHSRPWRRGFLGLLCFLLLSSLSLVPLGLVRLKMLPFDNKNELQVIIDMPEGTTLETTANVACRLSAALRDEPEVSNIEIYAGAAAPFNFNGLVRHYFLRQGPNVADLQVNLTSKHERRVQSHDFARRIRPRLEAIARHARARIKIAEVPPGPPVLQTLVAEIYHPVPERRLEIARKVLEIFETTEGVVDPDWYVEDPQVREVVQVDPEKAALHGVSVADVSRSISVAIGGLDMGLAHAENEREDCAIHISLPRTQRNNLEDALSLPLRAAASPVSNAMVPLRELVRVEKEPAPASIYHKNLLPVIHVTGDVSGREESPAYAVLKLRKSLRPPDLGLSTVLRSHSSFA